MPMLKRRKGESKTGNAVRTEMTKMKSGTLHSGSKAGPKVKNPKQAIAIGLSEARKAGAKVPAKGEKKMPFSKGGEKAAEGVKKYRKASEKMAHRKKRNLGRP